MVYADHITSNFLKDVDVVLVFLLLTLNIFYTIFLVFLFMTLNK